jgi:ribosome biogenesis GTPase
MRPLIGTCKYADCRHVSEPGCAVKEAVEMGRIARDRLESYQMLLGELNALPEEWE